MYRMTCLTEWIGVVPLLARTLLPPLLIWSCHVVPVMGEASHMGGEVHLRFSFCFFAFLHTSTWCTGWRFKEHVFVLFSPFFSSFFDRTVTSAIHSTALPCQQDKTVVVKQSKQSPDGNKVPVVWFTNRISPPFAGHSLTGSGNQACCAW